MESQEARVAAAEARIQRAQRKFDAVLAQIDEVPGGFLGGDVPVTLLEAYGSAERDVIAARAAGEAVVEQWGWVNVEEWRAGYRAVGVVARQVGADDAGSASGSGSGSGGGGRKVSKRRSSSRVRSARHIWKERRHSAGR
jgi:hypothetical protein